MQNNTVIFDKPYSADKIAEGRAIQWAVVSGACNKCDYLRRCESDVFFQFPQNAACMIKKNEILRSDNNAE
ncbi:MAG: hypothetical protein IK955_08705 [Clostridia bacterium]|nr:hypothetical protein [Clostridia bacterium]